MIAPVVQVATRPLAEPDKRLSQHPAPRSVISASLRSSKGIQVGADLHARPLNVAQDVVVLVPVVRLPLALAVEPLAQNARGVIDVAGATACIVRDGVVVEVSLHPRLGAGEHFCLGLLVPGAACPIAERPQAGPELLAAGAALDLEAGHGLGVTDSGSSLALPHQVLYCHI